MSGIPKPEYRSSPATSAYLYQATPPPPPPSQLWSAPAAAPVPTSVAPSANANAAAAAASFFCLGPRPKSCAFCHGQGHHVYTCTIANEYVNSGHATIINDRVHLLNSQPIPYDSINRGIKASIDSWLTAQNAPPASKTRTMLQSTDQFFLFPLLWTTQYTARSTTPSAYKYSTCTCTCTSCPAHTILTASPTCLQPIPY